MDPGSAHSNCFPARHRFRTGRRGAGHWRVLETPKDDDFDMVVSSASAEQKRRSETLNTQHWGRSRTRHPPQNVLDAAFLMKVHCVKNPSDLCVVDVSDKHLTAAKEEEFLQFNSVAYINATDNALALESFRTFAQLTELELPLNRIRRIQIRPGDFPRLRVLDLSYNFLSPDDITQLGALPRLQVLHLTGNGLTYLPGHLTTPPSDHEEERFPCLEVLILDDNRLSHPSVFQSLAGLKSLRLLNLDSNGISAVPYLHPCVSSRQGEEAEHGDTAVRGTEEIMRGGANGEKIMRGGANGEEMDYIVQTSTTDPDRTEVIFLSTQNASPSDPFPKPQKTVFSSSTLPSFLLSSSEELLQSFSPPLPSLTTLSLADNKISHEEDLLAAALFPSLEELVIHGNPLTTRRKGDPPLLHSFLQQRLGVRITRKKMEAANKPPRLVIPVREQRKVSAHIPKIPKQPLMIEPPIHPFLRLFGHDGDITGHVMSSTPLPPIRRSPDREQDTPTGRSQEETSEAEHRSDPEPAFESFFQTQVEDLLDRPRWTNPVPAPEERDTGENVEDEEVPEKFRGYEELYHVTTDPEFIEPVGIQNNVRALEYALTHLRVFPDSKQSPGSIQKPHIPQENKPRTDLPPNHWKSKKEVLADVLTSMRERPQLLEVPLESALVEESGREHRAARRLLSDLHRKYASFYSEAAKRAEITTM